VHSFRVIKILHHPPCHLALAFVRDEALAVPAVLVGLVAAVGGAEVKQHPAKGSVRAFDHFCFKPFCLPVSPISKFSHRSSDIAAVPHLHLIKNPFMPDDRTTFHQGVWLEAILGVGPCIVT